MGQTFDIAGPDIAAEEFDGEYVVLNLKSGMYFSVRPAAAVIWKALVAGHSGEALQAALPARSADIEKAMAAFVSNGLLVPAERQTTGDVSDLARTLVEAEPDFGVERSEERRVGKECRSGG